MGESSCYVSKVLWVSSEEISLSWLALHGSWGMEGDHCCYSCGPDGKGSPKGLAQLS